MDVLQASHKNVSHTHTLPLIHTKGKGKKKIWEKRIEKKSVGSSLSCVVAEFIADNFFFFNDSGGGGASERERKNGSTDGGGNTFSRHC